MTEDNFGRLALTLRKGEGFEFEGDGHVVTFWVVEVAPGWTVLSYESLEVQGHLPLIVGSTFEFILSPSAVIKITFLRQDNHRGVFRLEADRNYPIRRVTECTWPRP